ncbi:transcription-repair-coupling factor [Vallitalea longa]|uniref:Transcription-repair-coupling factor n=1 Tax=Vallitalea longa TaxID=2936439 RepID=A0A9W6DGH3_9FIRM|nr:transcription-repair coupling factor [Vallitalea longa]GKX30542.1 transcription-repair-coupling factor [Vallitalea longa]
MKTLVQPLRELEAFNDALEKINKKISPIYLTGAIDSEKCHLMHALGENRNKLIITYNELRAREVYEDMKFFNDDNVFLYPAKDVIFYSADVHSNDIIEQRINVIKKLYDSSEYTVILSIEALMDKLISKSVFEDSIINKKVGDTINLTSMSEKLMFMGYERVSQVESKGQFAIRGGIIDIYPPTDKNAYRIELWDEEIDSIRMMNIESQRSISKIDSIEIYPAREVIVNKERIQKAIKNIKQDRDTLIKSFKANDKTEEIERLKDSVDVLIDKINNQKTFNGIEGYIEYFYEDTVSFLEYFSRNTLIYIDEPTRINEKWESTKKEFNESIINRFEKGYLLKGQTEILRTIDDLLYKIEDYTCVLLSTLQQKTDRFNYKYNVNFSVKSINPYHKSMEILEKDLKYWSNNRYRTLLITGSKTRAERLSYELKDRGIDAFYLSKLDAEIPKGKVAVSYGSLHKGFEYPLIKFVIISETDLVGKSKKRKKTKKKKFKGSKIESFTELKIGDYVVHENYGIGIFRGTEKIEIDGVSKDYIKISYRDEGNLYISTSQLDVIQKYIGSEGKKPKLNKLGTNEWKKTKNRVKGIVEDLAKDLVELYAKRQAKQGYEFSGDTVWQKEFEEMFPYEETDDQLIAIEETKTDMESKKIMDRLICGDVGYGKTEVAIRAAFKSVQDDKQVAYLVPTTILAQQHYNNFLQRMKDFPVRVEMLSRFKSQKEQKKIIEDTKKGLVDILIGTHRLISKDVVFKNLGLLIIDEEQRFGVSHKEKIKKVKQDIDVLTLTATPIPRTLHMSLIGIRDMSVLEEPPEERHPIQTYVLEHNDELIKDAIYRELSRGGQIYYVYNRVKKIDEVADWISKMVPEANVAFAHGQMNERELENIMFEYINGDIDILVCTTIIETGLDIQNTNTIIIQDADRLGLSQLYQLRGRVGRSNRVAYAYLLYKKDKILQETAEKRLQAIKEFTEFGSGFKIAMRDLEIRGAGNLLGARQHGHMESVGYDLYCKLLEEAIHEVSNEKVEENFETSVELNVDAFIPSTYIKDEIRKLGAYKKIASIENEKDYYDVQEELEDRYGDLPKSVINLLDIAYIKAIANKADIVNIEQKGDNIKFEAKKDAKINPDKIPEMLNKYRNQLFFTINKAPYFTYKINRVDKKQFFRHIKNVLQDIKDLKDA